MENKTKQVLQRASLVLTLFLYGLFLIFSEKSKFSAPQPVKDGIKNSSSGIVKTLLITSWRSGSTIIGQLLNSHPGSIYNYEPLMYAGINRIYEKDKDWASSAKSIINGLLYCNFSIIFNEFRLGLDVALNFLDDPNVKIIFVVRDPRGLLNSRLEREWCLTAPRCINPDLICKDLEADFLVAKKLIKEKRNQILVLRYEEFSMKIWDQTKSIYDFLGLPISTETREFLLNHTQSERFSNVKLEVWNTYRDPRKAPFHWKTTLPFGKVLKVQDKCQIAMKLWGYKMAISEEELLTENWNPLVEWQLPVS